MKRKVAAILMIFFALVVTAGRQDRPKTLALKLECFEPGRLFRFTISNVSQSLTNVIIGQRLGDGSWTPQIALFVRQSPREPPELYRPGTLGPGRKAAGFAGRIDDVPVPLPPGAAYVMELGADLFGWPNSKPITAGVIEVSGVLEANPFVHSNSGVTSDAEYLERYKPRVGRLVSNPLRVPADCSTARR